MPGRPASSPWIIKFATPPSAGLLSKVLFILSRAKIAVAQASDARSLAAALQNISGTSSIFSLVPLLTGKVQNVKCIAARTFPGALAVAGLGAGRVLSKLQVGILLLSSDLYRNLVGDVSYFHDEYVNRFSPPLIHIPTGTPERHSSNVIVNHNITEDYMVEAWFQTQGRPAKVELGQGNNRRVFVGMLIYLLLYAFETFLGVRNAATGTALALIVLQVISGSCWVVGVCLLQANRGQGTRFIHLNRLATSDYRCYQLVTSGSNVQSALLSTQLSNIREYNLFGSQYEGRMLKVVGGMVVASGMIDIIATVLVVGLNPWAYGWLGFEVFLILLKVVFSLEPLRRIPIVNVQPLEEAAATDPPAPGSPLRSTPKIRLPIIVSCAANYTFTEVCISRNVVLENHTSMVWRSRSPGLFIGQPYYAFDEKACTPTSVSSGTLSPVTESVRYLCLDGGKLTLGVKEPQKESNQALQREFLACLAEVVRANKVPSTEFVFAVEATMQGIRRTMGDSNWYAFGTTDLVRYLNQSHEELLWRRFV